MSENLETPRLKLIYEEEIRASLIKQFGYKNKMQTPVLDKIIINMGVGEGSADKKKIEDIINLLNIQDLKKRLMNDIKTVKNQIMHPDQLSENRKNYSEKMVGRLDGKASNRIIDYLLNNI